MCLRFNAEWVDFVPAAAGGSVTFGAPLSKKRHFKLLISWGGVRASNCKIIVWLTSNTEQPDCVSPDASACISATAAPVGR